MIVRVRMSESGDSCCLPSERGVRSEGDLISSWCLDVSRATYHDILCLMGHVANTGHQNVIPTCTATETRTRKPTGTHTHTQLLLNEFLRGNVVSS